MCGIAGIFKTAGGEIDLSILNTMTDLLEHRGPDDRGVWTDEYAGLGHRRLSIIDREGGVQPMSDPTGRFHITYNGEIYNYRELREVLKAKGHHFKTRSDTEVLLHCYMEYGVRCPEKLNGMFAFAVWDSVERTLFLARDRLGIKPLYYSQVGDDFIFASEIKSILAYPGMNREPNMKVLGFYLAHYQNVMGDETLFKGINSLMPGYCLTLNLDKFRKSCYWMLPIIPESEKDDKGENYYIAAIREKMVKSVDLQMLSDVPVGAYLSGGLDSSILVALMTELCGEQIKTYAIGFPEDGYNEFFYSDQVASAWGTAHTQITIEEDDYFRNLKKLIKFKDAPLSVPNEVPLYLMSEVLRDNITVVLSGEGSDELFGGYGAIMRSPFDYLRSLPDSPVPKAQRKLLNRALMRLYRKTEFESELDHFLMVYSWMKPHELKSIFNPEVFSENRGFTNLQDFWRRRFAPLKNLDLYNKYLYIMESIHLPGLLGRLDTTTMAASVEGRVPFTDPELIELVSAIPWKYKLRWNSPFYENMCNRLNSLEISETMDTTKYILKRSFVDKVPPDVMFRKKFSFPVPLNNWLSSGSLSNFIPLAMENCPDFFDKKGLLKWAGEEGDSDKALKIWMLMNVFIWYDEYFSHAPEKQYVGKDFAVA